MRKNIGKKNKGAIKNGRRNISTKKEKENKSSRLQKKNVNNERQTSSFTQKKKRSQSFDSKTQIIAKCH